MCDLQEIGTGEEESLQQVIFYRSGDKTGKLDLEEWRESRNFSVYLPSSMAGVNLYMLNVHLEQPYLLLAANTSICK